MGTRKGGTINPSSNQRPILFYFCDRLVVNFFLPLFYIWFSEKPRAKFSAIVIRRLYGTVGLLARQSDRCTITTSSDTKVDVIHVESNTRRLGSRLISYSLSSFFFCSFHYYFFRLEMYWLGYVPVLLVRQKRVTILAPNTSDNSFHLFAF